MFSLVYNHQKLRFALFPLAENALFSSYLRWEQVLVYKVCHVAPPCFYNSPEHWHYRGHPPATGASSTKLHAWKRRSIQLGAICSLTTKCHNITHIAPLTLDKVDHVRNNLQWGCREMTHLNLGKCLML